MKKLIAYGSSAIVFPFLIAWAYLYFSRIGNRDNGTLDWATLAIGLIVGLICIAALPLEKGVRVLVAVLYAPMISFALIFFSLAYVCGRFSDCL